MSKGKANPNNSFTLAGKTGLAHQGPKVPNMSQLNKSLVPQLYMRGYSPSKPQWKF